MGSTTQLSGLSFNQIGLLILLFEFLKSFFSHLNCFTFICEVILSARFIFGTNWKKKMKDPCLNVWIKMLNELNCAF